jgi:hypothetical protein
MQAITKAMDNGWDPVILVNDPEGMFEMKITECKDLESRVQFRHNLLASMLISRGNLFGHEFAKHFWGEKDYEGVMIKNVSGYEAEYLGKNWEGHLQQMVLEEDPISYLYNFVDYEYEVEGETPTESKIVTLGNDGI